MGKYYVLCVFPNAERYQALYEQITEVAATATRVTPLCVASYPDAVKLYKEYGTSILFALLDVDVEPNPKENKDIFAFFSVAYTNELSVLVITQNGKREDEVKQLNHMFPTFIGVHLVKGEEYNALLKQIERLCSNRQKKVLIYADSKRMEQFLQEELKRYLFMVHALPNLDQVSAVLKENQDIHVVIIADKKFSARTLRALKTIRQEVAYNVGLICLKEIKGQGAQIIPLDFGCDVVMPYYANSCEVGLQVTVLAARVDKERVLTEEVTTRQRYLAIAAHDLRNSTGGIKGFSQLLLDGKVGSLTKEQQKVVNIINRSSATTLQFISDILDFAAIENGTLKIVKKTARLDILVAERLELAMQAFVDKKVHVRKVLTLVECPFDAARMGQVIDNLLLNALKFTRNDSELVVRVGKTGSEISLSVTDQGKGIPVEERHKLFSPFEKLMVSRTQSGGTGLGLSVAACIVHAHGGRILVDSILDKGTTFQVLIPCGDSA